MYSSTGSTNSRKHKPVTAGYLVRPKLGALRSLYRPSSVLSNEKRKKNKKISPVPPKMEFRKKPDYADTAYREAVGRLRILLAETYTPIRSRIYSGNRPFRELDSGGDETDNQSMASAGSRNSKINRLPYNYYNHYYPSFSKKYYVSPLKKNYPAPAGNNHDDDDPKMVKQDSAKFAPPELMSFIERQEDYIEQLEKESRFCKEELSSLLSKVKEVIRENEHLHAKQKSKLVESVFDQFDVETETETDVEITRPLVKSTRLPNGPSSIIFESKISELEAQLTQNKIDMKKCQEENDTLRKKLADGSTSSNTGNNIHYENLKKQFDSCKKERDEAFDQIKTLQSTLSLLKHKENDNSDQLKRSLDIAEQSQYEKSAAETEIRRLKDELERQHLKLRDTIAEQGRRISDERASLERRYAQQIDQLNADANIQWETTSKLQLELDKQRRENGDLRRECAQKQALIDELKKDMQNKILTLQSDIGATGAEKSALEQQLAALNMANERTERQYKQEQTRLQAEIQSLRQRLDRADADLIHSRRENIRLNEQVASLEKEINLNAALNEERKAVAVPPVTASIPLVPSNVETREKQLTSMLESMENKHAATVAELESMIHSQNQLMDKLSSECHILTEKLEGNDKKHKEEIRELQTNLDRLNDKFSQAEFNVKADINAQQSLNTAAASNHPPFQQDTNNAQPLEQYDTNQYQTDTSNLQYDPNQQYSTTDQYQYDPNQQYDENQSYDPQQYDINNMNNQMYATDGGDQYANVDDQYYAEGTGGENEEIVGQQQPQQETDQFQT